MTHIECRNLKPPFISVAGCRYHPRQHIKNKLHTKNSITIMTTPISFHLFPFLPLGLQMQIWRGAAEPLGLWQLACVSFVHIPLEWGISDLLGGTYMSMDWDGEDS